jgi:hypothetical protein
MHAESFKDGANVVTESVDDNKEDFAVKWSLEYCGNEPTNISSGGATQ